MYQLIKSMNESMDKSINESINQSINESIDKLYFDTIKSSVTMLVNNPLLHITYIR